MTVSIFSSSLFVPNLFSNCVVDERPQDVIELLHILYSVLFYLLLISAAYAGVLSDVFLGRTSSRFCAMLRTSSVRLFVFSVVHSLSFFTGLGKGTLQIIVNSAFGQSYAIALLTHLSTLQTGKNHVTFVRPRLHPHVQIRHKDLETRLFSLSPSQFLGMKSLIRYGVESTGFAAKFRSGVLMLFSMSTLLLIVPVFSAPSC